MEIATTRVSSRGQIVIPVGMRTEFKEGDNLVIFRNGDCTEDEEAFAYLQ